MKKIFKNLLIASSLLLPITTVASATLSSIINSEVQNNKVPEIQKGNYEFDGKFFDSAEKAKQYAINNTEKKLEQINTGEASWKINYNGSDKMLDSYDFQKFNEYAQKTNEYIIYADEKSIVENTISESTGQINSSWFNSVFIEAQSPTEYKEYYRGNNNSIYKTKDDAIASLTNSNNSALFFNDIYFQNPSDLRNYLNNIYFNKDNPGYATDKYSNSIRLTAPNGNVSEMIVFDQAGEWKKIASDFIINNSEKIIEFSTDNGFVYLTEKNIDKVLNYLSVEDVPYVDVASNQGNQTWYIDINKDDESALIGPKWYSGPSDLSTITDKSLWIRNQSFNSDIVSQNAFQELLSGLFQELLGENKLIASNELFNTEGKLSLLESIQSQYKILLELEGYISVYNEAVESYKIMASGKSFNYFDKIPLLYSFITSRLVKAKAPQKVIYITNAFFKDVTNIIQKQIDIIFSEVPGNVLLSKNGKDTFNLVEIFGFTTKKISLNLPSSAYFNEIFNNYTKFVFAGLGYLESLDYINANLTNTEMRIDLLKTYLDYLPKNTSPEEKEGYIAAAKDTYKYFVNQNKYTLLANNEIFKKYNSKMSSSIEAEAAKIVIDKLEKNNIANDIAIQISNYASELYLSNNKWENVDINNKFRQYIIWVKEEINEELSPNDILKTVNVASADNLLYWDSIFVNMNIYFNEDPQGIKILKSIKNISEILFNSFKPKQTVDKFNENIEKFVNTSNPKVNIPMYKATYMDFNSFFALNTIDMMGDLSKNKEIFIRNADDNLVFDNKFEVEMFNIINGLSNNCEIISEMYLLYNSYNKIQKNIANLDFEYQMKGLDAKWDYSNPYLIENINKFNTMYAYFINKNWDILKTEFLKLNIEIIDNPRFTFDGAYDVVEEKVVSDIQNDKPLSFKIKNLDNDTSWFINKYTKEINLVNSNEAEIKSNGLGSISYIPNPKFLNEKNNETNSMITNFDAKNNEYEIKLEKFLQPFIPIMGEKIEDQNKSRLSNLDFTLNFHKLENNKNIIAQTYLYNYLSDDHYNHISDEEFIKIRNLTFSDDKKLYSNDEDNEIKYKISNNWEKVLTENQGIVKPADFITLRTSNPYNSNNYAGWFFPRPQPNDNWIKPNPGDVIPQRVIYDVSRKDKNLLYLPAKQKLVAEFNNRSTISYSQKVSSIKIATASLDRFDVRSLSSLNISSDIISNSSNASNSSKNTNKIESVLSNLQDDTRKLDTKSNSTISRTNSSIGNQAVGKIESTRSSYVHSLSSNSSIIGAIQTIRPDTLNNAHAIIPSSIEKVNTWQASDVTVKPDQSGRTSSVSRSNISKTSNRSKLNVLLTSSEMNVETSSQHSIRSEINSIISNSNHSESSIRQTALSQTNLASIKQQKSSKIKSVLRKIAWAAEGFGAAIGGVAFIIQMVMMFLPKEKQVSYSYNVGDVSYTWLGGKEEFNAITSWEIKGLKDMKINDPVKISDSFTRDFKYYDGEEYVDDTQLKMKFLSNVLSKKGEAESDTPWYSNSKIKKGYTFDILDSKIENTILPESIWGVLDAKASPEELSKDILSKINSESDLNTSEYASNILHKYDNGYSNWSSVNESAAIARAVDEILSNIRNTYISLKPIEDSEGFVSKRKEYNLIPGNSYDSLLNRIVTREEKIKQDPNFNDNNFIIDNTANVVDPITGEFADMNKMSAQINAKNISTANYNKYMSDKIKTIKAELAVYNGANDDFSKLNGLNGTTVSSLAVNEYGDVNYFVNSLKKDGFGNIVGRSSSNKNAVNWLFDQYQLEKINKKTWTYVYEYKNQYFLSIDSLIESFGGINKIDNNGKKV